MYELQFRIFLYMQQLQQKTDFFYCLNEIYLLAIYSKRLANWTACLSHMWQEDI